LSHTATVTDTRRTAGAPAAGRRLHALLVEFETPGAIKEAARRIRDAGFVRWDTHTPFPVHGIDEQMGIQRTKLPFLVFACGAAGCLTGLLLQWWTNASSVDLPAALNFIRGYPFQVSGKPFWSLPANIPVIFELTVLFSAFGAVFGMLVLNDLPKHYNPLFRSQRFRRVTDDRFFLCVEAADPSYDPQHTPALLKSLGGTAVEEVYDEPTPPAPTKLVNRVLVVLLCLALIPPAIIAKARVSRSDSPRIHLIQDMDNQEKFKTQREYPLFADQRVMRLPVAGAVARGELGDDAHFARGIVGNGYAEQFPTHRAEVQLTAEFLQRGHDKYGVYCAPCHGLDGSGQGRINQRAIELEEAAWVAAAALTDAERRSRPVGHLFNTITNGIRTMGPYGDRISPEDRWAIVAYVRALQRAHYPRAGDLAAVEDIGPRARDGGE
jgi:mono/diheme cytochrome c family protein